MAMAGWLFDKPIRGGHELLAMRASTSSSIPGLKSSPDRGSSVDGVASTSPEIFAVDSRTWAVPRLRNQDRRCRHFLRSLNAPERDGFQYATANYISEAAKLWRAWRHARC